MRGRGWVLAKKNVSWGSGREGGVCENKQGRKRGEGGGVKTQESWANVLFECPLFETTDLFFRVIRHDSSVLLSQNFIYFKKPIKVQIWWNFTWSVESLKLCTLIGYFCPNHVQFQLKKYRRDLSWHWRVIRFLKKNSLFVWKTTWETWWILTQAVKNL